MSIVNSLHKLPVSHQMSVRKRTKNCRRGLGKLFKNVRLKSIRILKKVCWKVLKQFSIVGLMSNNNLIKDQKIVGLSSSEFLLKSDKFLKANETLFII